MSLRLRETFAVSLVLVGGFFALSLGSFHPVDPSFSNAVLVAQTHNLGGWFGAYLADVLITLFGLAAYTPAGVCFLYAGMLLLNRAEQEWLLQVLIVPILLLSLCAVLQLTMPLPGWPYAGQLYAGFGNGGLLGKLLAVWLVPNIGYIASLTVCSAALVLALLWVTGCSLGDVYAVVRWVAQHVRVASIQVYRWVRRLRFKRPDQFDLPLSSPSVVRPKPKVTVSLPAALPAPRGETERQTLLPLDLTDGYVLPPLTILQDPPPAKDLPSEADLTQNARRLEAELKNFGVEGRITHIAPGPVITIYELAPAAGVKTSQIVGLADDLARAMSAIAIRIAAIPGRNVIGIEMPTPKRQMVTLKQLLDTAEFEHHPGKLTVALGVDTAGRPVYADLAKMPHALIAGTTGSGKSVAMNTFILSLVYRLTPDEVRFLMVDPKMLELSIYNDIPHLLTPVITDPGKAAGALGWVVKEMENRYKLMSELNVKNLQSFNAKLGELLQEGDIPMRQVQTGFDLHTGQPQYEMQPLAEKPLPHIVVVIDELADLMMVAGKQVEISIARLTQMARASGIHLLVATQRPSVDVVTGLIKANIPTRMSFSVASRIDSRTVLDAMGAEQLLGKGDMLYLENGSNGLQRLHGAFVSEEECNQVAAFLKKQAPQGANYIDGLRTVAAPSGANGGAVLAGEGSDGDELYQQAVQIVAKEQKASTSFLQRHLKIGYNRAADLIDRMEADGLITEANHVGKREVLMKGAAAE